MEHLDLDVSQLDLDCSNPRHDNVVDQVAALHALVEDQSRKLTNLALDIHRHGLSPAQRLVVEQVNERYTVIDGNRRLAALRILETPGLLPSGVPPVNFAEKISGPSKRPGRVACCLVPDRDSAAVWLERTHTGQFDGIGVVPWSPTAQHRFRPRPHRDQTATAVAVSDWLRKRTNNELVLDQITTVLQDSSTNLGRLLSDPGVRLLIGFEFDKDNVCAKAPESALIRRFSLIVTDLAGSTGVSVLKNKEDRERYIRNLLSSDFHPDGNGCQLDLDTVRAGDPGRGVDVSTPAKSVSTLPPDGDNHSASSSPINEAQPAAVGRSTRRKRPQRLFQDLNPAGFKTRTKSILEELQQLDIDKFTNAAAFLIRSAVEFCVAEYLLSVDIKDDTKGSLEAQIRKAIEQLRLQIEGKRKKKRYHGITSELSKPDSIIAVTHLNNYVHNRDCPPSASELVTISSRYTVLIQDISDVLQQERRTQLP